MVIKDSELDFTAGIGAVNDLKNLGFSTEFIVEGPLSPAMRLQLLRTQCR